MKIAVIPIKKVTGTSRLTFAFLHMEQNPRRDQKESKHCERTLIMIGLSDYDNCVSANIIPYYIGAVIQISSRHQASGYSKRYNFQK